MGDSRGKLAAVLAEIEGSGGQDISRATSPGGTSADNGNQNMARSRPRTYPYFRYLPYDVEDETVLYNNLDTIIKHLYVCIEAGDFAPGAVHWTRELRSWLGLKFDLSKAQRVKLVKLYYELALAPGIDVAVAERFSNMLMALTK